MNSEFKIQEGKNSKICDTHYDLWGSLGCDLQELPGYDLQELPGYDLQELPGYDLQELPRYKMKCVLSGIED
uniref:Uncharacterized protein n=2 Tax=Loa loa TaxID=7209 RepID=A0A1I7VZK7_LOALO